MSEHELAVEVAGRPAVRLRFNEPTEDDLEYARDAFERSLRRIKRKRASGIEVTARDVSRAWARAEREGFGRAKARLEQLLAEGAPQDQIDEAYRLMHEIALPAKLLQAQLPEARALQEGMWQGLLFRLTVAEDGGRFFSSPDDVARHPAGEQVQLAAVKVPHVVAAFGLRHHLLYDTVSI